MKTKRQVLHLMTIFQRRSYPALVWLLNDHRSLHQRLSKARTFRVVRSTLTGPTSSYSCINKTRQPIRKDFHSSTSLQLNRILFDIHELDPQSILEPNGVPFVIIPRDDYRTEHAAKILGLENGDTLRAGIIMDTEFPLETNCTSPFEKYRGYTTDGARIEWLPEGKNKNPSPTKNGDPPGSLKIFLHSLSKVSVDIDSRSSNGSLLQPIIPSVSLILALPRPLALARLLPMIAQIGVKDLILISAAKVPRDYFGSHLFRKPNELRRLLVEGLCQAGDVRIPRVRVVHRLKPFLEDGELDSLFPLDSYARVLAHPMRLDSIGIETPLRMSQVVFPKSSNSDINNMINIVLAVGPEGGWAEPYEIDLFKCMGFQHVTLGTRILRSDVAVISLLSLAHDICDRRRCFE